jgi:hypothetical protein
MAYITRDANYVLLFLIVIAIIIIVGVTIFYKKNFEELNEEYTLKLDELNRISEELAQKQSLLNETQLELGLKAKREEDFPTKYTETNFLTGKVSCEAQSQISRIWKWKKLLSPLKETNLKWSGTITILSGANARMK